MAMAGRRTTETESILTAVEREECARGREGYQCGQPHIVLLQSTCILIIDGLNEMDFCGLLNSRAKSNLSYH